MLIWHGKAVEDKVKKGVKAGMEKVLENCVKKSKELVPVRTGTLKKGIEKKEIKEELNELVGLWGVFEVLYAFYVEYGTYKMAAQPFLFPAADQYYPTVVSEIKKALRKESVFWIGI